MKGQPALVDEAAATSRKRRDGADSAETQIPPWMLIRVLSELPHTVNIGFDLDLNIDRRLAHESSLPHRRQLPESRSATKSQSS
jgi:hypothetical protein